MAKPPQSTMPVTPEALKRLILCAGVSPQVVEAIDPTLPLSRQGVDSIAHPLFILAIEDQLDVHITEDQALSLRTLNDFLTLLNGEETA